MKEEVYSYIVSSIHLLNQSIKTQDTKNVKLFSYLYNNYTDIKEQIQLKPNNEDVQLLSYCILNLDTKIKRVIKKTQNIDDNIVKINNKLDDILDYINNKEKEENITKDNKFKIWCQKTSKNIIELFKRTYNRIYKFIFKKKLQRLEEERKRKEQEELEKQREEKKRIIRNILEGNK